MAVIEVWSPTAAKPLFSELTDGHAELSVHPGSYTLNAHLVGFIDRWITFTCDSGAVLELPVELVEDEAYTVPLIQLIANPADWDRKHVRVKGFLNLEKTHGELFLHEEDSRHGLVDNGLYLDIPADHPLRHRKINHRYVIVDGMFRKKDPSYVEVYSGQLKEVGSIAVWNPRSK